MREDDLRDVFGALHAANDPDLGFGVTDVVRAGHRVRRRRRTAAAVGSGFATVAAAVVAVVLLPAERAPAPADPADVVLTTTSTAPPPAVEPVPSSPAPAIGVPGTGSVRDGFPAVENSPDGTPPPGASENPPRADPH